MVATVALLNLSYFGVEFAVALAIGSVSLFADSIDFLEDTSINLLIFVALGWSTLWRARVGTVLAGILLVPGAGDAVDGLGQVHGAGAAGAGALSLAGAGALAVNLTCSFLLGSLPPPRRKPDAGGLPVGAQRCDRQCRNRRRRPGDRLHLSAWPDLIVGLGIAAMNADAAPSKSFFNSLLVLLCHEILMATGTS